MRYVDVEKVKLCSICSSIFIVNDNEMIGDKGIEPIYCKYTEYLIILLANADEETNHVMLNIDDKFTRHYNMA